MLLLPRNLLTMLATSCRPGVLEARPAESLSLVVLQTAGLQGQRPWQHPTTAAKGQVDQPVALARPASHQTQHAGTWI